MEKDRIISLKKQIDVTDLAGEKVMIDFESGKYFLIKGVGNEIWECLQTETTAQKIIDKFLAEYDVESKVCEQEVIEFLDSMEKYGFI